MTANAEQTTRISFEDLVALLKAVFLKAGTSESVADCLARNCAATERDGVTSHGIFRMKGYLASLGTNWVDGQADPKVEDAGPSFVRVDAANGFTQPALAAATPLLLEKVKANGVAVAAIRQSHHLSALWPDVEPFARQGLVAFAYVNSYAYVAPPGGHSPVYGTNPIAFASPRAGEDPLAIDLATSAVANGEVQVAAREGRELAPGCGINSESQPTTDPKAILDGGALLPFGGYKGASLAMMVEILSAALTGGQFSFEVDWSDHPGAVTPKTGELIILIDPERGGQGNFANRVEFLLRQIMEAGQDRLPGERRYERRRKAMAEGIPVSAADLQELRAAAGEA